jgi:hypothetical protein
MGQSYTTGIHVLQLHCSAHETSLIVKATKRAIFVLEIFLIDTAALTDTARVLSSAHRVGNRSEGRRHCLRVTERGRVRHSLAAQGTSGDLAGNNALGRLQPHSRLYLMTDLRSRQC